MVGDELCKQHVGSFAKHEPLREFTLPSRRASSAGPEVLTSLGLR